MAFACEGITRRNRIHARQRARLLSSCKKAKVKEISKGILASYLSPTETKRLKLWRDFNGTEVQNLVVWVVDLPLIIKINATSFVCMTDKNKFHFMVQWAEAIVILKQNKAIQNGRLQERLPHVPACSNLCWQMLCRLVSFVTVVHRQPLTDLHPHSPVFRSLLYPCRGCSLRGKQNICAGQAGAAGRSRSAERCEEGQNPPLRALFNQKELAVSDLAKRILNPAPVHFQLPSSCRKPL